MSTRGDHVTPSAATVAARQRALLAWYEAHARDLPWRREPTLYGTWLSEIMLQQTTVATVGPRWEAFRRQFPDVAALASARESEVVAAWSGLGYYRRARLLHQAAREVMAMRDGALPQSRDDWRAMPGVGEYTAGAIASIGLSEDAAAVDANVRRVLLRWHCEHGDEAAALRARQLTELATVHLPTGRAGAWNQALMDLGAGICHPVEPTCDQCPVAAWCRAGIADVTDTVPPATIRPPAVPVLLGALVVVWRGQVWLQPADAMVATSTRGLGRPARSQLGGLLAGTLTVPMTAWYPAPTVRDDEPLARAWRGWLEARGWQQPVVSVRGLARHAITRYRLQVVVFVAHRSEAESWPPDKGAWCDRDDPDLPLTTLVKRVLNTANDL